MFRSATFNVLCAVREVWAGAVFMFLRFLRLVPDLGLVEWWFVRTPFEIITGICGVLGGLQGPSPAGFVLLLKAELESHRGTSTRLNDAACSGSGLGLNGYYRWNLIGHPSCHPNNFKYDWLYARSEAGHRHAEYKPHFFSCSSTTLNLRGGSALK